MSVRFGKTFFRRAAAERGETQLGIILGALFLGVLCCIIFTLKGCIFEHKESKVRKRREQALKMMQRSLPGPQREIKGYRVSY